MQGELTRVRELSGRQISRWDELARRSVEPNPMSESGFVVPAASHQDNGPGVRLVTASDADGMMGAVPICRAARHGGVRRPVVTTDIRRMTYLGTPLLDRRRGAEAALCMLSTLARERRRACGMLVLKWIDGDGLAAQWIHRAADELGLPVVIYEDFEQPFLSRRQDGDYEQLLSKKHGKDYARRARRLEELLGHELQVIDRAGDPEATDAFLALEAAGYKADSGVAMLTHRGEPQYFREMCQQMAETGRLHHLELRCGERVVATQISVRGGDTLFLIKLAHDEEFARYDPGIQLHLRAIQFFHHQTDATDIRVCTFAGNELLLRLYPERRRTITLLIGLGGHVDHAVVRALPTARRLSRQLRWRGSASTRGTDPAQV